MKNILKDENTNLSISQKEMLLWHQRLSHASIGWVQLLMREKQWLKGEEGDSSLHSGPFIVAKHKAPTCDVTRMKCAACLCTKATIKTPENMNPRASQKKYILKTDNLKPGNCICADHYFSPVSGRLPHTYGREKHGYTCGSLFVDHASGKIFNFPQFSNNTTETLKSVAVLESKAYDEGFKIKRYHSDNRIFSSTEFKEHCDR
jgi:hypothetical protein